jgi:hypothetical protein
MMRAYRGHAAGLRPWSPTATLVLALLLGGCVTFVSSFDQASVDRTNEISKSVLALYQELLAAAPADRPAAMAGPLRAKQGDIETQIRLHVLREQARTPNDEGSTVAGNLLESWQTFSTSHLSGNDTALTDATLNAERQILERHLRSAFVAEESKKLAGNSAQ